MNLAAEPGAALRERLTRTVENAAFYAALTSAHGVREISELVGYSAEPRYRLIRVDHRLNLIGDNDFEIALVDDAHSSVAYYNKVTLVRIPEADERIAARDAVWRSASNRHSLALRDISQKVLFGHIAQHYDILLTEGDLSGGGKFYWHRHVSRAIEGGLHVSVYQQAARVFRLISTQSALNDIQDQAWSGASPEPRVVLVSILPLDNR
nr:hypothetical protein [uncultured Pseudomonas sp.]